MIDRLADNDDLFVEIHRELAARNMYRDELLTLRAYRLPNERRIAVVTDRNRFRYNPETRTLEDMNMPDIQQIDPNMVAQLREVIQQAENMTIPRPNPANRPEPVVQAANEPADVVGVIVRRNPHYGGWEIRVNRNGANMGLPDVGVIKSLLPPEWKRLLGGRHSRRRRTDYYLTQALEAGLPTQVLHDTLQAWAFTWIKATAEVSSIANAPSPSADESFLLTAQPATIFVGGKSFKLVPTGERNNTNIYRHIRDKAKAVAQIEVQAKLDKAQTDARIMIAEANERATATRREVEQLRASLGNQAPEWARLSGRPIKYADGSWYIGLKVSTYLEDIRYRVDAWHATLHWNPIRVPSHNEAYYQARPMPAWFLLSADGRYDMYYVMADYWNTVHTADRACMELQGLPTRVDSFNRLRDLENAISRGVRVINWNSPLSRSWDRFYPLYQEQIPPMFKSIILQEISLPEGNAGGIATPEEYLTRANSGAPEGRPRISWDRVETDAQDLAYTFTVGPTTGTTRQG